MKLDLVVSTFLNKISFLFEKLNHTSTRSDGVAALCSRIVFSIHNSTPPITLTLYQQHNTNTKGKGSATVISRTTFPKGLTDTLHNIYQLHSQFQSPFSFTFILILEIIQKVRDLVAKKEGRLNVSFTGVWDLYPPLKQPGRDQYLL